MIDFAVQRLNMVESQVRPSDVTDRRLPRAMQALPREAFVPDAQKSVCYRDNHVQVGGTTRRGVLLEPRTLAKLVQELSIEPDASVLDIGGATGYSAAVLASLAKSVVAVESDQDLAARAKGALAAAKVGNVTVVIAALTAGAADKGPYDAIFINGAIETMPAGLLDQLKDRGRLVAVVLEGGVGKATLWQRSGKTFDRRSLFDASAPQLPGFERKSEFVF